MTVLRDYNPYTTTPTQQQSLSSSLFSTDINSQVASGNAVLQGATLRTSTAFGRAATVKAGEDIRPALESLKSAGGGTLILLAGTHKPTYDIVGGSKINIVGEGINQTIIDFGLQEYNINYTLVNNFVLRDFTVKNCGNNIDGIEIQGCNEFTVQTVSAESNDGNGFVFSSSYNYRVNGCTARLNGFSGFEFVSQLLSGSGNDNYNFIVNGCFSEDNTSHGFRLRTASSWVTYNFSFFSCIALGNSGDGFSLEDAVNIVAGSLVGCVCQSNSGWDIDVSASRVSIVGCSSSNGTSFLRTSSTSQKLTVIGCTSSGDYYLEGGVAVSGVSLGDDIPFAQLSDLTDKGIEVTGSHDGSTTTERKHCMMLNTSGGTLTGGSVVIFKAAADGDEVTTTTTVGDDYVFGMVLDDIASNAYGLVLVQGYTKKLKVNGTTDIAIGDFLCTYSVAGIASKATAGDMAFAIALEAYTTNDSSGVIDALLITPRKL